DGRIGMVRQPRSIQFYSKRCSASSLSADARAQRAGDRAFVHFGSVVAFDEQRDTSVALDMLCPRERVIERGKFLEQKLLFFQRRDIFRAFRTAVDAIT